jgi:adenylylsulfate kinase-like enzyme
MKKKKLDKNKGILFWVTGLPGSGKSSIAKKIKKKIIKKYGHTILINGDDMRNIFELKKYSQKERLNNGIKFSNFCKFLINQKINVIFAVVGLFDKVREKNKKNIKNYIEIYIKSDLKKIIKKGKKGIYKKYKFNIVGKDLKPEFPKKPNILINNNFKKNVEELADEIFEKIQKIYI